MLFDPFHDFTPQHFIFKIARTREELDGYWALRRAIFCDEQKIFQGSDRDEIDGRATPIVCEALVAGMEDSVAGVVRIDEREPGVWYGSRLEVGIDFRSLKKLSPAVAARNQQPVYRGFGALGAGLIFKAVSTAHALGCKEFLATVQHWLVAFPSFGFLLSVPPEKTALAIAHFTARQIACASVGEITAGASLVLSYGLAQQTFLDRSAEAASLPDTTCQ